MKPIDLKNWMKKNNKKPLHVAAEAGVSPRTVERFLKDETTPHDSIMKLLTDLVDKYEQKQKS